MLFNSIDFAVFLPLVFFVYWFVANKSLRLQNYVLLIASYIFYGWWDWRFLTLIVFSTLVDFLVGVRLSIEKNQTKRRILFWTSIVVNLGFLGFFKYYNFFLENFIIGFSFFGMDINPSSLNIILPVGISFYTFQTLSYSIDVYKRRLEATKDFIAFSAFVTFFPQLVAGPIERATNLLPQFYKKRRFVYTEAVDGMRQILWGLFKKIVVADNCAQYSNEIFNNSAEYSGATLILGAIFFAFQIYGDFSGYSDIAIGTSRLFGFNLLKNFAFPYFSRDIAEFWRRWHISLSTWFRDYLYVPLGGSRGGTWMTVRNTFVIFVVSGFWHGANWTFIAWGALNAIYFLPVLLLNRNRRNLDTVANGKLIPSVKEFFSMIFTFGLTVVAWVFFRAETIQHAMSYLSGMFSYDSHMRDHNNYSVPILLMTFFILIEWLGRENQYAIAKFGFKKGRLFRWAFYAFLIFLIGMFMKTEETPFIYFQF